MGVLVKRYAVACHLQRDGWLSERDVWLSLEGWVAKNLEEWVAKLRGMGDKLIW
jgi:hypothetical protein